MFDPSLRVNTQQSRTSYEMGHHGLSSLIPMEGMVAPPCDFRIIDHIARGVQSLSITDLPFLDPNAFLPGQIYLHARDWEHIVARAPYDEAYEVLNWVKNKVSVHKSFRHFSGSFKGRHFDSDIPPPMVFDNNKSCDNSNLLTTPS